MTPDPTPAAESTARWSWIAAGGLAAALGVPIGFALKRAMTSPGLSAMSALPILAGIALVVVVVAVAAVMARARHQRALLRVLLASLAGLLIGVALAASVSSGYRYSVATDGAIRLALTEAGEPWVGHATCETGDESDRIQSVATQAIAFVGGRAVQVRIMTSAGAPLEVRLIQGAATNQVPALGYTEYGGTTDPSRGTVAADGTSGSTDVTLTRVDGPPLASLGDPSEVDGTIEWVCGPELPTWAAEVPEVSILRGAFTAVDVDDEASPVDLVIADMQGLCDGSERGFTSFSEIGVTASGSPAPVDLAFVGDQVHVTIDLDPTAAGPEIDATVPADGKNGPNTFFGRVEVPSIGSVALSADWSCRPA